MSLQRIAAGLGLLALSPLLMTVGLLIRLESRGPILFTQTRVGLRANRFEMLKFRSMYLSTDPRFREPDVQACDREGVCKKFHNDPRITFFGRYLRKLSIDELPQLINVVRGDMALVGPRPGMPSEIDAYQFEQLDRLNAEPGLTGLWQVSGRANTTFERQVELDLQYIKQRSPWTDLKILIATVPAVLSGEGAY